MTETDYPEKRPANATDDQVTVEKKQHPHRPSVQKSQLTIRPSEDQLQIDQESLTPTAKKQDRNSKLGRILTFFGLQLALFLAALDGTIVSTALPRIGSDFNQMAIVAWVATAYILTFDAFQPMFSKFSDIFGRKWILMFGIVVFLIGSVLCGAAQSMIMLICCRAIAGIGAAAVFSMVFVIISDLVPLEKRGSYQGLINGVFALASVLGPLIGGSFTDYVSWRWNFYINLPIGAAAMIILMVFLQLPMPQENFKAKMLRIDYIGTVLVLAFATLFLLAMNFGGQAYPWKSTAVLLPLVLSVLIIGALVYVECKIAKEPLLPPPLFKNRSINCILISNWFFGSILFTTLYYLPIYFQVVKGDSAMWSGIRLIPMQMVICVFSTSSGLLITKTGFYRPLITLGTGLLALCMGLFSMLDIHTPWPLIYGFTVIAGAGMGCIFPSSVIGLQASAPAKDIAIITGLGSFCRILGGALGIAIASAVLNSSLTDVLAEHIPEEYARKVISSSEYVRNGLPAEYLERTLQVYVDALQLIWHVMIPMAGVAFLCSLLVRHYSLRRASPSPPNNKADMEEKQTQDPAQSTSHERDVAINMTSNHDTIIEDSATLGPAAEKHFREERP
ncbi:major facilitator superfamily domain-containing protein [Radiomyces spectabilis]|uniref:major facilitator superfamily domain-containing protein n=1 Tax=Radiomyces spectabilis TaxID=64574 RepID=UPI00222070E9|nr:major facilitator superfamily domain-containing protein [Radiomyces spectabilis]KAI8391665.1 major facilitator superfamily domain-containing protein [Radiomyces spectabilis]